jgi:phosphoribosylformimino-5-aminoimidazole carboxamide ribonucleotide (ProFAR) isomerase
MRRASVKRKTKETQISGALGIEGRGAYDSLVRMLASRAVTRVGGGVRSVDRARALIDQGARKVIVGTAAFTPTGANQQFLNGASRRHRPRAHHPRTRLQSRPHRRQGWTESTTLTAEEVLHTVEPYCSGFLCTYVDKEGMMQGADLAWFRRLRATTSLELTAAGGITTLDEVRTLLDMNVHAALGMAIYTGRLNLSDLSSPNLPSSNLA